MIRFNTWTTARKAWTDCKTPMRMTYSNPRGKGFTLISAIGKPIRNSVLYKFAKSTNADEFYTFIENLVEAKIDKRSRPILVSEVEPLTL